MTTNIYFYCSPFKSPEKSSYQHLTICLAEGLKSLGIPYYSDINYWKLIPDEEKYLFQQNPEVLPNDCDVVVLNDMWFEAGYDLPKDLFHPNRKYKTVYFESWGVSNYSRDPIFRKFDFIFKTHFSQKLAYPSNIYPWAFGLSERILNANNNIPVFEDRVKSILVNFRLSHPIRQKMNRDFIPLIEHLLKPDQSSDRLDVYPSNSYDYLMWQQTGRRHYPSYYHRLQAAVACASFGGIFRNWPKNYTTQKQFVHRILNKLDFRVPAILRWESWRFWESLAAGCVPFQIDYEKYGALLPAMPENWKHYIGIDLSNQKKVVEKLSDEPDILKEIAVQGRQWAIENYSPVPTAKRFLEIVKS